jgi:hypothetical protein
MLSPYPFLLHEALRRDIVDAPQSILWSVHRLLVLSVLPLLAATPPVAFVERTIAADGQIVCSTPEEPAAFKLFCPEITEELAPVVAIERFLAKSISENMYGLERARAIENATYADGCRERVDEIESGYLEVSPASAASRAFLEQAHSTSLFSTYEGRLRPGLEKDLAQGGFFFSSDEIVRRRDRQARFRGAQPRHFDVRRGRCQGPTAA